MEQKEQQLLAENTQEIKRTYQTILEKEIKRTYQTILEKEIKSWDIVVLISSNEMQAKSFEMQIKMRKRNHMLPKTTKFIISPDTDGKRIGSGGAILRVLTQLEKEYSLLNKKILILLSAGDNQRMSQASHFGKIFTNLPKERNFQTESTIFDELIMQTATIPQKMDPGIFIMCGDCLTYFNPNEVELRDKNAVAISMKMPKEIGTKHGVFVEGEENIITEFLHKQKLEILEEKAVEDNKINLDTGIVYLSSEIVNQLLQLVKKESEFNLFISQKTYLNFYSEFLYPLASNAELKDYLEQAGELENNSNLIKCKKRLWKILSPYQLNIIKLSPSFFLHLGTTREFLETVTNRLPEYSYLGFQKEINSIQASDKKATCINSIVENTELEENTYIENSVIKNCKIGNNVIVSNTIIENLEIPNEVVISTVLLKKDQYVTRIYDIDFDPKQKVENGYIFHEKLPKEMITKNELTFWNIPLYIAKNTVKESVEEALKLYRRIKERQNEEFETSEEGRISLSASFNQANSTEMLKKIEAQKENIIFQKVVSILYKKQNLKQAKQLIENSNYKRKIISRIKKIRDSSINTRKYYLLSMLEETQKENYLDKAFQSINIKTKRKLGKKKIKVKQKVIVESPIRINLAGGWSDTPPYCLEKGGCVLNLATTLNGNNPIKVIIEKIEEKKLIFHRLDCEKKKQIKSLNELKNGKKDQYSILKCTLLLSGMIKKNDKDLDGLFERIGAGIKISTDTKNIPEGSGLGTSSILSATVLKAMYEFMGITYSELDICYDVLKIEQMIKTGGGWQDQIGGIFSGMKLIKTEPGEHQIFDIQKVKLSDTMKKELNERLILINTGITRKSKNHLRIIMGNYIEGHKRTIEILDEIKDLAIEMTKILEHDILEQDILQELGEKLDHHWELLKELDLTCINKTMNNIVKNIEHLIAGKMICGAGGGGFIVVLLKKGMTKNDLDQQFIKNNSEIPIPTFSVTITE